MLNRQVNKQNIILNYHFSFHVSRSSKNNGILKQLSIVALNSFFLHFFFTGVNVFNFNSVFEITLFTSPVKSGL